MPGLQHARRNLRILLGALLAVDLACIVILVAPQTERGAEERRCTGAPSSPNVKQETRPRVKRSLTIYSGW